MPNMNGNRTESGNAITGGKDLHCDDCVRQPIPILRWCELCKSAICDACVLDHHIEHTIGCYQRASREFRAVIEKFRASTRNEAAQLRAKRTTLERLQEELTNKINSDVAKVQNRVNDAAEILDSMKAALKTLEILGREPLNGKTVCERSHAKKAVAALGETLVKRMDVINKQLEAADGLIEKAYSDIELGTELVQKS